MGLYSYGSPVSPNSQSFSEETILNIMQNVLERNILTWFLKFKRISAVFLKCDSNCLRQITLYENITLFWFCGLDC